MWLRVSNRNQGLYISSSMELKSWFGKAAVRVAYDSATRTISLTRGVSGARVRSQMVSGAEHAVAYVSRKVAAVPSDMPRFMTVGIDAVASDMALIGTLPDDLIPTASTHGKHSHPSWGELMQTAEHLDKQFQTHMQRLDVVREKIGRTITEYQQVHREIDGVYDRLKAVRDALENI